MLQGARDDASAGSTVCFGHPGAGSVLPGLASSFLEGKASKAAGLDQHSGGNDLLVKCRGEACTARTPAQERLLRAAQHGLMGFPAQGILVMQRASVEN